jgi:hypothetical protein
MKTSLIAVAWFITGLTPLTAEAQQASQNQGPMIVERVHSGFLVAPDVKVTEVDRRTSELAGGYAGWVADEAFFIGGGGYWLANGSSGRRMAYGGLVLQWLARSDRRVGFGVKGLVGGGRATLTDTVTTLVRVPSATRPTGRVDSGRLPSTFRTTTTDVRFRRDFFVAEPELDVLVRLTNRMHLTGGIGYRAVGAFRRDDNRLGGAVGSVAVQIGGGS